MRDYESLEATALELEAEIKALRVKAKELKTEYLENLNRGLKRVTIPCGWHGSILLRISEYKKIEMELPNGGGQSRITISIDTVKALRDQCQKAIDNYEMY